MTASDDTEEDDEHEAEQDEPAGPPRRRGGWNPLNCPLTAVVRLSPLTLVRRTGLKLTRTLLWELAGAGLVRAALELAGRRCVLAGWWRVVAGRRTAVRSCLRRRQDAGRRTPGRSCGRTP